MASVPPLVSVIIPTYNYAKFLPRAIDSVLRQTYHQTELIVVDDGSTDDTAELLRGRPLQYIHQQNKGLAAARNTGIRNAHGDMLVFLDADDWLEPEGIGRNLKFIQHQPEIAFVSGSHYFLKTETNTLYPVTVSVEQDHYMRLLECNYIGMHAAVMFRRWIFEEFRYDETLKACEDYDLYLSIARKYPVLHHQAFIATYFFHSSGLSHNYGLMRDSVLAVVKKQKPYLRSEAERAAYARGLEQPQEYQSLLELAEEGTSKQ